MHIPQPRLYFGPEFRPLPILDDFYRLANGTGHADRFWAGNRGALANLHPDLCCHEKSAPRPLGHAPVLHNAPGQRHLVPGHCQRGLPEKRPAPIRRLVFQVNFGEKSFSWHV